ncbi:MAG: uroporphyrinogen decarboxylase family protein [Candidatus Humimicrobiaceae bacterium]
MNSRERVKACLNFKKPDRLPRDLWALPYVISFQKEEYSEVIKEYPLDFETSQLSPGSSDVTVKMLEKKGNYTDDWGSLWYIGEPGVIGEVKKPAIDDWPKLRKFKPPYHLIKNRDISYINKSCEKSDKFMLSDVTSRPFERLQFLRGTENLFIDIADDRPEFQKLLRIVHEFYLKDIENWCKTNVDGIVFMDDWGKNNGLLINPKIWREIFKPLYKEYCNMIHNAGKFAFFHTDGDTEEIFGDFVDVGIDAINSQLFTMNIEEIGKKYKGRITFWGEIDRQYILPFGTLEEVENAVKRVKSALYSDEGGIIAQCEWGKNNLMQNIKTVFKAWNNQI